MKHNLFLLLAVMLLSIGAKAEKKMYAVLESDGTTMTLYYDTEREARGGVSDWTARGSSNYCRVVTKAVLDESVKDARPKNTYYWFAA